MKIKEVMKQTGLSEKTVRYYESMGLITPNKSDLNGRSFRDYTDEDVSELMSIAALRKARFSVEDIRQMKADPASIPQILVGYRKSLEDAYTFLSDLLTVMNTQAPERSADHHALAALFESSLQDVRLPEPDLKFNFKLLDEIEDERVKGIHKIPLLRRFGWTEIYSANSRSRCNEIELKLNEAGIPCRVSSYTAAQRLIVQNSTNNAQLAGIRAPSPVPHALQEKLLSQESLDNYKIEIPSRYLTRAKTVI